MRQVDLSTLPVASSETARQINRRIVLNLIRSRQPLSRADAARLSGLQRSTVSLIVEELIAENLVIEGATGRLPRGRRPTFLRLNEHRSVICVDIRPLRITVGVANVNGAFSAQETMATPADPAAAIQEIADRIRRLTKARPQQTVEGIGISLPGRIDVVTQQLVFAPNLKWPPTDLKEPLERKTGLSVELENAANACALSEIWFGRAAGVSNLVAITVSEGIGAGIVANGQLITGQNGMAGEFGHVPLDPAGPVCSCGNRGCWEVLASNSAALRYYFESGGRRSNAAAGALGFQDLLTLAEQGDLLAGRALNQMAVQLGRGARMVVAGLAPQAIAFIGEFTAAWDRFCPIIQTEVEAQNISGKPVAFIAAQDGAAARLRGTVALVLQKHFGAPSSVSPKR
ncbi:MAG TPA: ROK family protein [Bryobacteraceae bacterium]|jgi:predicted NBD/HSP70 family sugar kinase|nr:ROK family protein [Bryobacteraceae bacterium]